MTESDSNPVNRMEFTMSNPIVGITLDMEEKYYRIRTDYSAAIVKSGGIPVFIPPSENAIFYAEIIDGLIIPGGKDVNPLFYHEEALPQVKLAPRERSDFEVSLVKEMIKHHKPILGICYGMQLINVAFGGSLYQDIDSQLSSDINHKEGYHKILIGENMLFTQGEFSVNSTHHQAIKALAAGLVGFAFSLDKLIEAFYGKDYPFLLGVQWHPERLLEDKLSLDLFRTFITASKSRKNQTKL